MPPFLQNILRKEFLKIFNPAEEQAGEFARIKAIYTPSHRNSRWRDFAGFKKIHEYSDSTRAFVDRPNQPFVWLHLENDRAKNTGKVFVLGHGLSDSPYMYRDIGEVIFRAGFNVVAFPLSGHAQDSYLHLACVSADDWLADWRWAIQTSLSLGYGNETVAGGFSTSAAVLAKLLCEKQAPEITAALFFSPALRLRSQIGFGPPALARYLAYKVLQAGTTRFPWAHQRIYDVPPDSNKDGLEFRYHRIPAASILALLDVIRGTNQTEKIQIPIFTVMSPQDDVIDIKYVTEFMQELCSRTPSQLVHSGEGHVHPMLDHCKHDGALPATAEDNREFAKLESELKKFISRIA